MELSLPSPKNSELARKRELLVDVMQEMDTQSSRIEHDRIAHSKHLIPLIEQLDDQRLMQLQRNPQELKLHLPPKANVYAQLELILPMIVERNQNLATVLRTTGQAAQEIAIDGEVSDTAVSNYVAGQLALAQEEGIRRKKQEEFNRAKYFEQQANLNSAALSGYQTDQNQRADERRELERQHNKRTQEYNTAQRNNAQQNKKNLDKSVKDGQKRALKNQNEALKQQGSGRRSLWERALDEGKSSLFSAATGGVSDSLTFVGGSGKTRKARTKMVVAVSSVLGGLIVLTMGLS